MKLSLCAFALAVASGCHPHVTLPTPTPSWLPAQRVATFQQYVPVGNTKVITCTRNGGCSTDESISLANGVEVFYPEDLQPLVKPDSETARHIAGWDHDRSMRTALQLGGFVAILVGGGYLFRSIVAETDSGASPSRFGRDASIALVGGGFVTMLAAMVYGWSANDERSAAYRGFRHDLGDRLAVCVSGIALVPCEAPALPQPPPGPPQPIP